FLSKITRVEPSLQAAFVDYGGNRHGFLAFNEIHPDYYQIPHADRQAILEAEFGYQSRDDDDDDDQAEADREAADSDEDVASAEDSEAASLEADADDTEDAVADEPDFEADAIDVSHLLPEEPASSEDGVNEVADDQASTDGELAASADTAEAPQLDDAGADATDAQDVEAAQAEADDTAADEQAADVDGAEASEASEPKNPPKTIAAATPPDDRIVSEPLESDVTSGDGELEHAEADSAPQQPETTAAAIESIDGDGTELTSSDEAVEADEAGAEPSNQAGDEDTEVTTAAATDQDDGESSEAQHETVEARANDDDDDQDDESADEEIEVDDVGESDALEEVPTRARRRIRNYKIQEVIKRRQIVLVQVVKEERGNKGAALTTYLSLAGRYTVLMPNTARGGGISRKITNIQDRKRLKAIAQELDVPEGMGLIIRTAGAARTKQEIKRDFEYLLRLWESVRDLTLRSTAPSLVYEEGDLIKRSIRDLYSRDVEQVLVSGEEAYKEAKSFMRMLMPSHAKNVVKYEDAQPLFTRYRIEQQLNAMFSPFVQLKSGGYLVINQTEALVAVDVNSGKSTRKFSIEDTALNTNLEAAEELTRQLKLRDLAGLIVIDFIDMEEKRNNRAVERRLKECLRDDRARIQVGRISHFGLLEMSRQRLRTGVLEGSTMPCQHCQGTGIIRSTESVALAVLRGLEDQLMTGHPRPLTALCSRDAAMYLLNQKREFVQEIEARYSVTVHIEASDDHQGADFVIQRQNGGSGGNSNNPPRRVEKNAVNVEAGFSDDNEDRSRGSDAESADGEERRPRRRRRRRGRRGEMDAANDQVEAGAETAEDSDAEAAAADAGDADGEQGERQSRRRRRGRRGGRNSRGQKRTNDDNIAAPGAPQPDVGDSEGGDWSEPQGEPLAASQSDSQDEGDAATIDDVAVASTAEISSSSDSPPVSAADEASEGTVDQVAADDTSDDGGSSQPAPEATAEATSDEPEPVVATEVEEAPTNGSTAANGAAVEAQEVVSDEAADEPSGAPRGEPESSEPVLERIVMTPESGGSEGSEAGQDVKERPVRKGWWQRSFGG
ncbi:MAG: Rne/Rng family ribonuclease, partial [Pseudomonadota bacterium]